MGRIKDYFWPPTTEGADMKPNDAWTSDAEAALRGIVRAQRERIRALEEELDRVNAFVYQVAGE